MDPMDIVGKSKEDASLPKGSSSSSSSFPSFDLYRSRLRVCDSGFDCIRVISINSYLTICLFVPYDFFLFSATMTKIIKEMLPADVRVARDAQDLLIECCVGKI